MATQLPVCTDARLYLPDGLPALPEQVADELREWLTHHGLDEKRIPISSSILRTGDGKWLVWEEWNTSLRARQLTARERILEVDDKVEGVRIKLQALIHPLPFPDSVREHVEHVRAERRAADAKAAADRAIAEADAAAAALEGGA